MTSQKFKKKWENYWYYYKLHTFAGIFILFVLLITITQCASNVNPDATIMLIAKTYPLVTDVSTSVENDLSQYITDFNKDGKKKISLLNIDLSGSDPTMLQASQTKFIGELQTADSFIFLIDESAFENYSKDGIFDKIKDIIPNALTVDDYRIPVSSLDIFKDNSYKSYLDNYYFVIRKYKGTAADNAANAPVYQNAVNFLKRIITNSKTT